MSLTRKEFNSQCKKLAEQSNDWYLDNHCTSDEQSILSKQEFRLTNKNKVCEFDYSVIYSESYNVPVMYFCVSNQDGSPVDIKDILTITCSNEEELGSIINQVEHPIYFRPFYMVHPCRTRDFMELHNPSNYMIAWLSTVGTLIGLELDNRLASLLVTGL